MAQSELRKGIAAISARERDDLLLRVVDGDTHVVAELRNRVRKENLASAAHRTAGMLRMRAKEIAEARERAEAERRGEEQRRQATGDQKARRARLHGDKQRGSSVLRETGQ